jgi:uncharacterized protein YdeI (YjbR/CyaY-like superfamily)
LSEAIYFTSPEEFRAWLEDNHESQTEVLVGYWKRATGKPSLTWSQAVDEALCFGWIDGVRRGVDDERHVQRFTPRKPTSNWSAVNIAKVEQLRAQGRMRPEQEARFRANAAAWEYFSACPPSYRTMAVWWVVSAKRPDTRDRRLSTLIEDSAAGRRLRQMSQWARKKA